jgi:hypothetical protein
MPIPLLNRSVQVSSRPGALYRKIHAGIRDVVGNRRGRRVDRSIGNR